MIKCAFETHKILTRVYRNKSPSLSTIKNWFGRFKEGDFSVNDKYKSGPPKKCEDEELIDLVKKNPSLTQKKIAEHFGVSQRGISKRMKKIGMIQKKNIWLPHDLSENNEKRRKDFSEKQKNFMWRLVTGNEKWIFFDNPKKDKSWVFPKETSLKKPQRNIHGKKVLSSVFCDQKGVIFFELRLIKIYIRRRMSIFFLITFLKRKTLHFFKRGIKLLIEKWQKTIDNEGKYFD